MLTEIFTFLQTVYSCNLIRCGYSFAKTICKLSSLIFTQRKYLTLFYHPELVLLVFLNSLKISGLFNDKFLGHKFQSKKIFKFGRTNKELIIHSSVYSFFPFFLFLFTFWIEWSRRQKNAVRGA